MTVVTGVAYYTVGQTTLLIQQLLNDQAGNLFKVPAGPNTPVPPGYIDLTEYINGAYRKIQAALANVGSPTFKQDNAQVVVSAIAIPDPGVQTAILYSTAPPNQLPADLIVPLKVEERLNGSTDDFWEMTDLTEHGGLPSQIQGETLQYWEWRGDGIYLLGATLDRQVRIRYQKALPELTDATSVILIARAKDPIAYYAAAAAAASRGAPNAEGFVEKGDNMLEDMLSRTVRANQHTSTRRRPYGSRQGYGPIV